MNTTAKRAISMKWIPRSNGVLWSRSPLKAEIYPGEVEPQLAGGLRLSILCRCFSSVGSAERSIPAIGEFGDATLIPNFGDVPEDLSAL